MNDPSHAAPVLTRIDGQVLHVVLNQPETRNPLGEPTVQALERALDTLQAHPELRVLVLSAHGPAFSAGGNLGNLQDRLSAPAQADGADPIARGNRRYGEFLSRFVDLPVITVAIVQGPAMGGGAGLACAADLCVAGPRARFGFPEVSIGLVPGQILPFVAARVGMQTARRLMLTGERIDGDEGLRLGLVDYRIDDVDAWETALADVLARCTRAAPRAVAHTKRLVRATHGLLCGPQEGLRDYLDRAADVFAAQMRRDAVEGVAAAREKRIPAWAP